MLTNILIIVAVVIVIALIAAAFRAKTFRVQRAASIHAPPSKIHALIDDFHNWSAWSPYEKLDPAMERSIGGAQRGRGAFYAWQSKGKAGKGRMEIKESSPPSKVVIQLDMSAPCAASNVVEFTLAPKSGSTEVTWAMTGRSPFMMRLVGLVLNIDRMVGKDFETGLASLKSVAEA